MAARDFPSLESPLLGIPAEVRIEIYKHYFTSTKSNYLRRQSEFKYVQDSWLGKAWLDYGYERGNTVIRHEFGITPGSPVVMLPIDLLTVSKLVHNEAIQVLYTTRKFNYSVRVPGLEVDDPHDCLYATPAPTSIFVDAFTPQQLSFIRHLSIDYCGIWPRVLLNVAAKEDLKASVDMEVSECLSHVLNMPSLKTFELVSLFLGETSFCHEERVNANFRQNRIDCVKHQIEACSFLVGPRSLEKLRQITTKIDSVSLMTPGTLPMVQEMTKKMSRQDKGASTWAYEVVTADTLPTPDMNIISRLTTFDPLLGPLHRTLLPTEPPMTKFMFWKCSTGNNTASQILPDDFKATCDVVPPLTVDCDKRGAAETFPSEIYGPVVRYKPT